MIKPTQPIIPATTQAMSWIIDFPRARSQYINTAHRIATPAVRMKRTIARVRLIPKRQPGLVFPQIAFSARTIVSRQKVVKIGSDMMVRDNPCVIGDRVINPATARPHQYEVLRLKLRQPQNNKALFKIVAARDSVFMRSGLPGKNLAKGESSNGKPNGYRVGSGSPGTFIKP